MLFYYITMKQGTFAPINLSKNEYKKLGTLDC